MVPKVTLNRPGVCWTYPYQTHPVYDQNRTGSATFFGGRDLADCTVEIWAERFNLSRFLSAVGLLDGPENSTCGPELLGAIHLNATGDGSFAVPGMPPGIYAIYVADENSSALLSASPLLVAETEMVVETPPQIRPGDLFPVKVGLEDRSPGRHLHYGAFAVSVEDYRRLSLEATGDGTLNGTLITAIWNEERLEIEGDLEVGWDLLARLLMIFPQNSAAALEESAEGEVELYMITEEDWEPGRYVLTCLVLSEGDLVGLNQTEVVIG